MQKIAVISLLVMSLILSACASRNANAQSDGSAPPDGISGPEVATTLPESGGGSSGEVPIEGGAAAIITFDDDGRIFTYAVGDTFMLDLGAGIYDWEISLEDETIFSFKAGEDGSQGVLEALQPGAVQLTAIGNPKCLKSNPPCAIPTVLFRVTLIVE
jgi:hypothetical protein